MLAATFVGPTSPGVWGTWLLMRWQAAEPWVSHGSSVLQFSQVQGMRCRWACTIAQRLSHKTLLVFAPSSGCYPTTRQESKRPCKKPCRFCWIKDQGGWSQQLYYLWKWKITLYTIVTTICAPSLHSSGSHCSSAHTSNHVAAGMRASTGQSALLPRAHIICIFRTPFADPGAANSLPAVCSSHVCWF